MVIQVKHIGVTVAQPGEGFSMGYAVIGTHAGKVVAEGMDLILFGILKFIFGT